MSKHAFTQVLKFAPEGETRLRKKFRFGADDARELVRQVLFSVLEKSPVRLRRPRPYFFQALGRRALDARRGRVDAVREPLVALEDEDRAKFFGPGARARRKQAHLVVQERRRGVISAVLRLRGSVVRVRLHLARRRLTLCAG